MRARVFIMDVLLPLFLVIHFGGSVLRIFIIFPLLNVYLISLR